MNFRKFIKPWYFFPWLHIQPREKIPWLDYKKY